MKTILLVALVLTQITLRNKAFAYEANVSNASEIHEVYVSYKFATSFCHVSGLDQALKRAYADCAENGFRQDECNIISVSEYSSSDINEPSGEEYSSYGGGMIYYKKLCTYQAKFQMIHKKVEKYDIILPAGYDLFGIESVVARFNLNTNGLANFYVKSVADAANYSSHFEFHMSVSKSAIGKTLDLGTICISQYHANSIPDNAPFTNDNFSLVITHAEKPKLFDECEGDEVPANAILKIIN
jgi:hypothetical protein